MLGTSEADDGAIVLPFAATRALQLIDAQVAWVPPREVSGLVRVLDQQQHRDQHGCAHLKRVHKALRSPPPPTEGALAILLCVGGADSLAADVRAILERCGAAPLTAQVPAHAPQTRRQFQEANCVWPVHFHEAAAARSLAVWSDAPADAELPAMRAHMQSAIAAARENARAGGRPVAAVVVRRAAAPVAEAIATCVDGTRGVGGAGGHPLAHAVMGCVEAVARRERAVAGRKRRAGGTDEEAEAAADEAAAEEGHAMHLCSECDVYVTHEPCAMCAMALVHSRVRRLVYALPVASGGALGSQYQLHCERSLNHHFTVVRGMLRGAAAAALDGGGEAAVACGG